MKYLITADKNFKASAIAIKENIPGLKWIDLTQTKFSDGEVSVEFKDTLRGHTLFLVASTTHENLIQTLLMLDASKRAGVEKLILISPYLGYARQDKREGLRGPMGAKLVADLLTVAGMHEIVTIDLHAPQIQGFFNLPVDHVEGHRIFTPMLVKRLKDQTDWVVCTPDAGGFQRATKFAKKLNLPIVAINKVRNKPNCIGSMQLIGDVKGKKVVIVDDMIDTAGTLCKAASYLKELGAQQVIAIGTHAILSGDACENITKGDLDEVWITDTNLSMKLLTQILDNPKITMISGFTLLTEVVENIIKGTSINEEK